MVHGSYVRDVGKPSECALNLASDLVELRKTDDLRWLIEKLKAAGLMKDSSYAASPRKIDMQRIPTAKDGGIPVEELKRIIRELKLNTGQSFWKNHANREDLIDVLLSYFKARTQQSTPKVSATSELASLTPKRTCASTFERIRQELMSARKQHDTAVERSETFVPPSYVGLLTRRKGGGAHKRGLLHSSSISRQLRRKTWRTLEINTTNGILYQARVGSAKYWNATKEHALRPRLSTNKEVPGSSFVGDAFALMSSSPMKIDQEEKKEYYGHPGEENHGAVECEGSEAKQGVNKEGGEVMMIRRKGAKSIYELSTRPDKGSLLIENGVLEALSVLSEVEDPITVRYAGASYVNLVTLKSCYRREMLKNQVVRSLHRLWGRGLGLAYGTSRTQITATSPPSRNIDIIWNPSENETDEEWRDRKCGLDVLHHTAVALCRLSSIMGSESIMMKEKGMEAIIWYTKHAHGNERLKVLGLQCLINFHLHAPEGTLHEATMPCLRELGQSSSVVSRRFTGNAICALACNKPGASYLLADGVISILSKLSDLPCIFETLEDKLQRASTECLLVDLCAQALSALTCANEEFARQAIIAPKTITLALEVLYLGGGGDGKEGARSKDWSKSKTKVAARCRLSGASSLVAIFEGVEASQNASLVQQGFLVMAERFLRLAEAFRDPKAQEVLAYCLWHATLTLTDARPTSRCSPPPSFIGGTGTVLKSILAFKARVKHKRKTSIASTVAGSEEPAPGTPRNIPGLRNRRRSSGGSSALGSVLDAGNLVRLKNSPTESRGGGLSNRKPSGKARYFSRQNSSAHIFAGRTPFTNGEIELIRRSSSQMPNGDRKDQMMQKDSNDAGGLRCNGGRGVGLPGMAEEDDILIEEEDAGASQEQEGYERSKESVFDLAGYHEDTKVPHVVACGVMAHLLRLAEYGATDFTRECCMGALCNVARKAWINAEILKEIGLLKTLLNSVRVSLARAEDAAAALAAKGAWNIISHLSQDRVFIDDSVKSGVVGSLCGAAKGAADLLIALDKVRHRGAITSSNDPQEMVETASAERLTAAEEDGDDAFREQMRQTIKACLGTLHVMLKHKWVRASPFISDIRKDLLITLVTCSVGGTEAAEVTMAIMCNLTNDVCCNLGIIEETGALQHAFSQVFFENRVILRHVAGTLGNLASVLEPTPTGMRVVKPGDVTVFEVLKHLADSDDQRLAFRSSAVLYSLTRKRDCLKILPDLKGLSELVFKIFRSTVLYTQNYCLQALFNLVHKKEFAKSIVDSDMIEGFIVACMVQTNSAYIKEMSTELLFYLISNQSTRAAVLRGQGLWTLVQLATASRSAMSMRHALLALFNLACDLEGNSKWLDEHILSVALEFDDEVLGAPAFPGLLYLASTHNGRLSKVLMSTRMAREATAKTGGAKFLKRNRALEEDEKFMARATAVPRPGSEESDDSSFDDDDNLSQKSRRGSEEEITGSRCRLRPSFVATHLLPTLATVYNLCCKSAKAAKFFVRGGMAESMAGLLDEMHSTDEESHYHPQVETMIVAILGCMVEDAKLMPKLVDSRVTLSIVRGLGSRVVYVRLASLWSLLLLTIPTTGERTIRSSSGPWGYAKPLRTWMQLCRQMVTDYEAVAALWLLWKDTAASLDNKARESVRYAISTILRVFLMDQAVAAAVVQQRGVELAAMMMDFPEETPAKQPPLPDHEHNSSFDQGSSTMTNVATLCCAIPTVYLPSIPLKSVCEGCFHVFLRVLPTRDDELRSLCSLAMRCLSGKNDLLLDLIMEPRFTDILTLLLEDATPTGRAHIRAILQRVVVLSAAPDVADLSPSLLDLTDCVFQRKGVEKEVRATTLFNTGNAPQRSGVERGSTASPGQVESNASISSSVVGAGTNGSARGTSEHIGPAPQSSKKGSDNMAKGYGAAQKSASPLPPSSNSRQAFVREQRMNRLVRLCATRHGMIHQERTESEIIGTFSGGEVGGANCRPGRDSAASSKAVLASVFDVFQEIDYVSARQQEDLEGGDGQRKQRAKMPTQANQEGVIADMNITESSSASPTTMDSGKLDYSGIADGLVGSPDVFPLHSTRVGKHGVVAMSGLPGENLDIKRREIAEEFEKEDESSEESSQSTISNIDPLEMSYSDDEVRQVKRLVNRVVEAELPAATDETVAEVIMQLREVTKRHRTAFQETSTEFRQEILRTRRGQALPLPHAIRTGDEGLVPWGEEAANDSEAHRLRHYSYWNPANEVLRLAGVKELKMKPAWNFTRKQNLSITRFADETKTPFSPEVAVPVPFPEILALPYKKRGNMTLCTRDLLPEWCVLESLGKRPVTERPSMSGGDNTKLKKSDFSDAKETGEGDDSSQASMSGGERSSTHPLAGRMRSRQESTMGTMSGNSQGYVPVKQAGNRGHTTIDTRSPRVGRSKYFRSRCGSSRNKRSKAFAESHILTLTGDDSISHRSADFRSAGGEGNENVGTGAETTNPYSASHYIGTGLLEDPVIIAATRAAEVGLASTTSYGPQSAVRSAIPAMKSEMFSFKTRWLTERRDAARARQKLMKALGVGSKRTLKDPVGGTVVPMSGMGGWGAPLLPKRPQVS